MGKGEARSQGVGRKLPGVGSRTAVGVAKQQSSFGGVTGLDGPLEATEGSPLSELDTESHSRV